jgi:hypothetical protein
MLRGLGIENLLKGLFVMRGGKLGTGKRSGDMPCKHHDLPKMAELAAAGDGQRPRDESLRPTAEEQPMIYALHGCLQFAGRYPIPRDPKNVILHTNTTFDDRVAWSRARESLFESFLRRLAVGFYGGSESDFSGEGEDPDRQARRAAMRQSMDVWVCWPFIETGGCVGDGPLAHWAVASLSLAWDVRIQL